MSSGDEAEGRNWWTAASLVVGIVDVGVGVQVLTRSRRRLLGACILVVGVAFVISALATGVGAYSSQVEDPLAGAGEAAALAVPAALVAIGVLGAVIPLLLPDGHLRRPLGPPLLAAAALGLALVVVATVSRPAPWRPPPPDNWFTAEGDLRGVLDRLGTSGRFTLAAVATVAVITVAARWLRLRPHVDPLRGWLIAGALTAWFAAVPDDHPASRRAIHGAVVERSWRRRIAFGPGPGSVVAPCTGGRDSRGVPDRDRDGRRATPKMTDDEVQAFLDETGHLVRIGTVDDDGMPRVVSTWFVRQGGDVLFTPRAPAVFLANLRRDRRVGLSIDEDPLPYRKVTVQSRARIVHEPGADDDWRDLYRDIAKRHAEPEEPDAYVDGTDDQPRALVAVPLRGADVRLSAWRMPLPGEAPTGIWARRYFLDGTKMAEHPDAVGRSATAGLHEDRHSGAAGGR